MADSSLSGISRPPTALNPPHRPVTQQGLSGGRAVSRLGTGSMRQVHDKSYYMGVLRSKINQISSEIARLEEVYQRGQRDRMELDVYEQRAKESAMEVKELQRKLLNYNLLEATVQELFHERQAREYEIDELGAEIEEQKRLNQTMLSGMDPNLRETYEELKKESESLSTKVEEAQDELARLDEKKEQLELELMNSPVKKKAMELKQLLIDLKAKEASLIAEKEAMETPEQKKQKLIEEIKNNNEDIATIEKQIEKTNELINTAHEEIREFDSSADNKLAKNNEKYRDLMVKEREYDEFLNTFEEQKQSLLAELEKHGNEVVRILQKISANIGQVHQAELNVTAMDTDGLLHGKASAKELQDLYVRLKEQIIAMDEQETRLNSEMQAFERRMQEMEEQRNVYSDIDHLAAEVEDNIKKLDENRDTLERTLPGVRQRRDALEEQLRNLNKQLESNPEYAEIRSLQRELEMLTEKNARLQAEAESFEKETNYEPIKAEVKRLRALYNEHLVAAASGRK
nr:CRE-IFT-74 protein [Haemonchus contortus]